ncbi:MAG: hypothetical protein KAU07_04530 [Candidatus Andersenbacteria bacterium]|nr:hypothetical protein [Candidatus Andersenbacteria bacterium]
MKTKKQKTNLNISNIFLRAMVASFILLISIFSILFISVLETSFETEKNYSNNYPINTEGVKIITDKSIYIANEKINLTVKNNEKQPIYFEPCEYLNNFEKKINGEWRKENTVINDDYYYNQVSFNRNRSLTECKIEPPKSGGGIYRSVIKIYYDCKKPGHTTCAYSKTFYSNEFEIKNAVKGCGCRK